MRTLPSESNDASAHRHCSSSQHFISALTGPNYELLGEVCALARTGSGADVVASGGIGSLEDLRRLRGLVPIGLGGVVVGTALYQGLFSIAEALDIAEGERPLTVSLTKENA